MKAKRSTPLNLSEPELAPVAPDMGLAAPASTPQREEGVARWLRRAPVDEVAAETMIPPETPTPSAPLTATAPEQPLAQRSTSEPSSYDEARPLAAPAPDRSRVLYALAAIASLLWAALAVFAYGYQRPLSGIDFQPFQTAVFVVLTLAPIGFIWIFAYGMRQTSRLAAGVARAHGLSRTLLQPTAAAAGETSSVVHAIRDEIDAATGAAARAREELTALRDLLSEETERLSQAAALSARTAATLGESLGRERQELGALAERLDGQATAVSDAVTRQARMVSEASDLAQAQIGEAEAALAARAADLAAAAGEASGAARIASEDLSRQVMRLETASVGVSDQVRSVEDTLTQQRASLVAVAHGLHADHEDFAVKLEAQQARLGEQMARTHAAASEITQAAGEGADGVRGLADEALGRCRELGDLLRQERDLLAAGALQSLGAVAEAARFEREAMQDEARAGVDLLATHVEQAQALTAKQSELARARIDELSEAAFAAGQRAEAAYEARVGEARALISRSAELIDGAAATSAERIEKAAADARDTLARLQAAVADFEARAQRLPRDTAAQAEALKASLAHSFDGLMDSARKAAEETQAIDKAFQERVRHNYEMLSEAVRLMGVMGPASRQALRTQMAAEPPPRPVAEAPAAEASSATATPDAAPPSQLVSVAPAQSPSAAPPRAVIARPPAGDPAAEETASADPGLRPRLRLAPTDGDARVSSVFDQAAKPAPAAPEGGGWSWQDLLTNMDDAPGDEQLAERLIGEAEGLGLDAMALLPAARTEELAAVITSGDAEGARLVISHLAPVAIRKLTRRLMTDRSVRAHAERFVRQFGATVTETARRDPEAVAVLLASDPGRAYLLFDAALGDLA